MWTCFVKSESGFVNLTNDEPEPEIYGSEPVSLKFKLSLKSMGPNLWAWNLNWAWTCEFEIWNLNLANAEDGKWWTCELEISECEPMIQSKNWYWQPFANDEVVNLNLWTCFPKSVTLSSTTVCRSPLLAASLVLRWYLALWILYVIVMFIVLYLCFILIFNFRDNARVLT